MKIRKLGTGRAPMTKFQQADQMDAKSIRAFVNDPKSWNPLYLYHAPGIPTFAGAVLSAQNLKLSTLDQSKVVIQAEQGWQFHCSCHHHFQRLRIEFETRKKR